METLQIFPFDGEHGKLLAVVDQPFQIGLARQLLIIVGKGDEQSRQIFCPQPRQLDCAFGDLDALADHQIGSLTAGTHAAVPPFSLVVLPPVPA